MTEALTPSSLFRRLSIRLAHEAHHDSHSAHAPKIGLAPDAHLTEEKLKGEFQGGYGNKQQPPAPAARAFARFPGWLMPDDAWYLGVDVLILAAAVRDWLTMNRVHPVYRYGLPALMLGQMTTMWIYRSGAPTWTAIAGALLW